MPLYEYKCVKCGERVEVIQRVSDPPYSICPKCGGDMQKQFSSPAIQFKGSGFYKTDYAKKSSSGGSGKSTDSKSESKSETKSDTGGGSSSNSGSSSDSGGTKSTD